MWACKFVAMYLCDYAVMLEKAELILSAADYSIFSNSHYQAF